MVVVSCRKCSARSISLHVSCKRRGDVVSCGPTNTVRCVCAGPPTASPFGHRCTVGVNRDPPVCHDVQGDIVTERQPVVVVVVVSVELTAV